MPQNKENVITIGDHSGNEELVVLYLKELIFEKINPLNSFLNPLCSIVRYYVAWVAEVDNKMNLNNRFSVILGLCLVLAAFMVTGSIETSLVYGSLQSTSSSNNGSPSSTPSSSGSSGSSGSTSSGSGSSGLGSAGSSSGGTNSGVVSGSSSNNPTPSSQGGSTAHCDRPGYPSCSSLGSEAGKNAAGSSCPPGHSKAFCSAYNVAAGTSTTTTKSGSSTQKGNTSASSVGNNTISSHQTDAAHCDQPAYPSCYIMGFKDGKSNPGTRCPSGHSVNFCAGWNAAAGNPPTKTTPRFA
ncbi:MAG: hypothetical protein M3044_02375, partial [Thermoproteota archaeon]|nr:hypothetical protein [Thermoproteota archaeon]